MTSRAIKTLFLGPDRHKKNRSYAHGFEGGHYDKPIDVKRCDVPSTFV